MSGSGGVGGAPPIRVLVVDDSLTVRGALVDILNADPGFVVVGEAGDGRQAIELCERLRPDVVTMDMMLPVMTGLSATEYIMAYCPTPIVIVSASFNRGEAFRTYDAIAAGAVDVVEKPNASTPNDAWTKKFLSTLRIASRIKVVTHRKRNLSAPPAPSSSKSLLPENIRLVAVGASTGGPGAVRQLLHDLPAGFSVPMLLVLHIAEPFDATLADWLDAQTAHRVSIAVHGESIFDQGPRVIMAPAGRHLRVTGDKLALDSGPERHSCRPSVDVLFESIAAGDMGGNTAAVLMTGMGRDGAQGLLEIRKAGGYTISQDEATSVVYGMPRAAVELGAAKLVLPLDLIGSALSRVVKSTAGGRE